MAYKSYVILTSEFYPHCDASGICTKKISDELIKKGCTVHIICDGERQDTILDGIIIHFVKRAFFKRFTEQLCNKNDTISIILFKVYFWIRRIILGIASPFIYPNVSPIRARKVYKKLKQICSKENIDYIIGTFRPYDNIYAVNKFKEKNRGYETKIVYWDLLTGKNPFGNKMKKYFKKLCLLSEKKNVIINDFVLYPESAKSKYVKYLKDYNDKIKYFDFPLFDTQGYNLIKPINNSKTIKIVFAGTIDGKNRNVDYFLKIIELLNDKYKMNIKMYFYGDFNDKKALEKYVNNDNILFKGNINPQKVFETLYSADCLVNFSNIITYEMVPSKIFQLFSTGNKIINMVNNENDASLPYFDKYPKVLNIYEYKNNFNENVKSVKVFIEEKTINLNFNDIKNIYYNNTPEAMANLL